LRRQDLTDQKFGRLIAKTFAGLDNHGHSVWLCECECGKTCEILATKLNTGSTKSCGCLFIDGLKSRYKGGKYITGKEFGLIRYRAKRENLEFDIFVQDIEDLYEQQDKKCILSGWPICFNERRQRAGKTNLGQASVDRIDSSKGYTKDNIQIVHKDINSAKSDRSDKYFIELCCAVADNYRSKNEV
jgi:hypothetical protein